MAGDPVFARHESTYRIYSPRNGTILDFPQSKPITGELEALYYSLYIDRSWIIRQVTTITPVDAKTYYRKITYDIDCDEVMRRMRLCHIPVDFAPQLYLPMRIGPKAPPLDIDVTDSSGSSLPMAPGSLNCRIGSYILCGASGYRFASMTSTQQEAHKNLLFKTLRRDSLTLGEKEHLETFTADHENLDRRNYFRHLDKLLNNRLFSVNFDCSKQSGTQIIKTKELVQGLSLSGNAMEFRAPTIGSVRSNHVCVDAPEGTWIKDMELWQNSALVLLKPEDAPNAKDRYTIRHHYIRSVLADKRLTSSDDTGNSYAIKVHLRPMRSYFLGPHVAVMAVSSIIHALLFAATIIMCQASPQGQRVSVNIGALVPVVALIPTVYAVFLYRVGEHKILSVLQKNWRAQGYLATVFTIVIAICYALISQNSNGVDALWLLVMSAIGAVVSLIFFAYGFWQFCKLGGDLRESERNSAKASREFYVH